MWCQLLATKIHKENLNLQIFIYSSFYLLSWKYSRIRLFFLILRISYKISIANIYLALPITFWFNQKLNFRRRLRRQPTEEQSWLVIFKVRGPQASLTTPDSQEHDDYDATLAQQILSLYAIKSNVTSVIMIRMMHLLVIKIIKLNIRQTQNQKMYGMLRHLKKLVNMSIRI